MVEIVKRRDAESILIVLWIIGTLVFAVYINWTINVRSILPLILAASILLMRRFDNSYTPQKSRILQKKNIKNKSVQTVAPSAARLTPLVWPLALAAVIALLVAHADFTLANSARTAAMQLRKTYPGDRILFEGHWGFQYYMELWEGKAVNYQGSDVLPDDIFVVPLNNTNLNPVREGTVLRLPDFIFKVCPWLTTMGSGAGFYSDAVGPLPYKFGFTPPEIYNVYRVISQDSKRSGFKQKQP
jgi:hypothetical protein